MAILNLAAGMLCLADIFRCVMIINHFLNGFRKGFLN